MYQSSFSVDPYTQKTPTRKATPIQIDSEISDKSKYFNKMNISPYNTSADTSIPLEKAQKASSPLRTNFIIVFTPLMFWGFPSHLLFLTKRTSSTGEWLKYLCPCSSPCTSLITIILTIVTLICNISTFYTFGRFVYIILFTAVVSEEIIDLFGDLLTLLPVTITWDLMWLKGYKLKNFIDSFDRVAKSWTPVDGRPFPKIPSGRVKLFFVYFLIICIHVLHFVTDYYREGENFLVNLELMSVKEQIWSIVVEYTSAILFTLAIPVYCAFCWAIKYELTLIKAYIDSLISSKVPPKYTHFDELKRICRKIVDDILQVNATFSILMSVAGGYLGFYVWSEAKNLGIVVLGEVMALYTGKQTNPFNPEHVRLIVGDLFIIFLYASLYGFTFWEMVQVNDEVRLLQVWLNDFVTEPESRLSAELYDSICLLKWYIHSRLEQEKPGLLSILALSMVPVLNGRLLRYKVVH